MKGADKPRPTCHPPLPGDLGEGVLEGTGGILEGLEFLRPEFDFDLLEDSGTADDGGGCVSPRPTARSYPSPTAGSLGTCPFLLGSKK